MIRFGIIGMGSVSAFHARSLQQIADAELKAVFSRSEQKARSAGEAYGVDYDTDLDRFLDRDDIDAVCVCTASGAHMDPAVAAAKAGKHVLVEKPIEITLERADGMAYSGWLPAAHGQTAPHPARSVRRIATRLP